MLDDAASHRQSARHLNQPHRRPIELLEVALIRRVPSTRRTRKLASPDSHPLAEMDVSHDEEARELRVAPQRGRDARELKNMLHATYWTTFAHSDSAPPSAVAAHERVHFQEPLQAASPNAPSPPPMAARAIAFQPTPVQLKT